MVSIGKKIDMKYFYEIFKFYLNKILDNLDNLTTDDADTHVSR